MKVVYLIRTVGNESQEEPKSYWTRQGVAFDNKDGSLNVRLDMFPGLTFNIRDPKETESNTDANAEV